MRLVVVPAIVLVAVALLATVPASAAPEQGATQFIVVLDDSVGAASAIATQHARRFGVDVTHVYENALKGYAGRLPAGVLGAVLGDARVTSVEVDAPVEAFTTQTNATWGLDRIDQRALPLSSTFTYQNTGAGVKAYIIDTGIRASHNEFGGRVVDGRDTVDGSLPAADCNGHGTHVAGTVGGSTYGVAKGVTLVAVRVLSCSGSGSTSGVIAGVDWVTADHAAGQPAVANMSLGGGASSALDTAVRNSIADGVSYAIAAGNGNIFGQAVNACTVSPARVGEAMTVSATMNTDRKASWANYGNCVDWFAPGVGITSAWYTSSTATNTISGTSMATPHTAGVAALYLQGNPGASPATVRSALFAATTKNIVTGARSANNDLLFTSY
ncbi:MAG: S8 family peptidase [Actinobacteria bacterium]|nr:S8 family peptidase [Actinomycetota bacterium]